MIVSRRAFATANDNNTKEGEQADNAAATIKPKEQQTVIFMNVLIHL